MKLLAILSLLTAASALAVPLAEDAPGSDGRSSLSQSEVSVETFPNPVLEKKTPQDDDVSASGLTLEKRLDGITIPDGPDPKKLLIGGVTVTFVMVSNWIREGNRNILRYTCKSIKFINNPGNGKKALTFGSGTIKWATNRILSEGRIWSEPAPEGGFPEKVNIIVGKA